MKTEIIKCGIEYVNEIHRLALKFYEITSDNPLSEKLKGTLAELLTHPKYGAVFLMKQSNNYMGYVILAFGFSIEYGGRDGFIDEFYINPVHRDKGIGTIAIEYIIKYSKATGIKALHLEVKEKHQNAEKFYVKNGFVTHNSKFMSLKLN